ncbi:hypothetical protein [Clostridium sp.]|uniref:hypothetical protein n=1 Tax=Clostridium sp. TaxID=1506 RepID=UPI0025BD7A3A|nr:hypothetical protein [Clostridium sp.]
MDYLKLYYKGHLKYWYMYFAIIVAVIPGYTISLIFSWLLANLGLNEFIAFLIAILIGGAIFSLPLLFSNYKISKDILIKGKSEINIYFLTLLNHIPSYLICCVLYIVIVNLSS